MSSRLSGFLIWVFFMIKRVLFFLLEFVWIRVLCLLGFVICK